MLRWFFVLLICSIIAAQQQQNSNYVTVNCSQGPVQGRQVDLGNDNSQLYSGQANVYTGIPYCQPPVDNLRFQPPQPLTTFNTSLLNATYFRPKCPQLNAGAPTNEDCLYLNIYTPQSATSSSTNLSVLVFIDGSNGFTNGGCDQSQEKGIISNLVQRQIVVVTLQYRIGALGFFTTYTNTVQSNLGMLDQVQAMTWIKSEIVNFGGNPNQITVAGQDDGACAVSAHTLSPMSQNLFNQAIVQSGSIYSCYNPTPAVPTNPTVYTTTPRPMYDQPNTGYGNAGYQGSYDYQPQSSTTPSPYNSANAQYDDPNQQLAATLCNISSADWNDGQTQNVQNCLKNYTVDFFVNQQPGGPTSTWMIVRDTSFLPGSIDSLSAKRPNIPIIIGTVQDEDADYAFKLINTGNGNDPNNLNNWIFDFAKKNKLNQTQTNQVSNIISNNYGVSTGASVIQNQNQNQNQQSNSGQVNNNNNNNQYQYPQANNGYQYTTQPSQQTNNQYQQTNTQYQGQQTNQFPDSGGVQTSYQNAGQYQQVSYNGQQYQNQNNQPYNQMVTTQPSQTSSQNQNQNFNTQQANNQYQQTNNQYQSQQTNQQYQNVVQYNGQQYQNQNQNQNQNNYNNQQYNQPSQTSVQNQNQNFNSQQANNQYQNNGYNTNTNLSQYNGGYLRDQPISMQNSNGITDFSQLRKISQISSDQSTSLTTTQIQSYMLNGDRHVRIYQFTHVSEVGRNTVPDTGANWKPVFKGQDMYFITMSETIWSNSSYTAQDRQVADQMGQRWSDFVKTGQVANWDTTSQQNYNYCNLNTQATQQAQYGQQARQVFQDQVNPICQVAQNNYAVANNQSVPYPSATANTNQIQRTPGTAQAQYTSGANGGSNFHITFQVNGVPFNG